MHAGELRDTAGRLRPRKTSEKNMIQVNPSMVHSIHKHLHHGGEYRAGG